MCEDERERTLPRRGGAAEQCGERTVRVIEADRIALRGHENQAQRAGGHLVEPRADLPERDAIRERNRHAPLNEARGLAGRIALQ